MKKILLSAAIVALASVTLTAASPKRLASFTETEYGTQYITSFTYDTEGRLIKVTESSSVIEIDYTNLANGKITMTDTETTDREVTTYDVTVNELGLVTSAVEKDSDGDGSTWQFEYSDGKLMKITIIEGKDQEYTDITWEDGVITSYLETETWDTEVTTVNITYAGVANTGNLALFDDIYGLDLDDLEYLGMSGFFGTIPIQLPTGISTKDNGGTETATVNWELDADGYPVRLTSPQEPNEVTTFAWEAASTGVKAIATESNQPSQFYTIDGRKTDGNTRGFIIEKKGDGTIVKRITGQF